MYKGDIPLQFSGIIILISNAAVTLSTARLSDTKYYYSK